MNLIIIILLSFSQPETTPSTFNQTESQILNQLYDEEIDCENCDEID